MKNKNKWVLIFLLALTLFLLRKIISVNGIPAFGDIIHHFYPWKVFLVNSFRSGFIPLWNPYIFCGNLFLANGQSSIFYPTTIFYLFLKPNIAINFEIILHFFLSGMFMFIYASSLKLSKTGSLFSSITYMFSGFIITHLHAGHLLFVYAYSWTPLIFFLFDKCIDLNHRSQALKLQLLPSYQSFLHRIKAGELRISSIVDNLRRKYIIFTAIVMAIQILAGHFQIAFISVFALFFYAVYKSFYIISPSFILATDNRSDFFYKGRFFVRYKIRRYKILPLLIFFSCLIIGAGLSSIQTLPVLESAPYSSRAHLPESFSLSFSLPFKHLLTFILPDFFGNPIKGNYWGDGYYWEYCCFVGILPLIFCLFSLFCFNKNRNFLFYFFLLIISLLFSLGFNLPFYRLLQNIIPGLKFFRAPTRFLFLATFAISILSGMGVDDLLNGRKKYLLNHLIYLNSFLIVALSVFLAFKSNFYFKGRKVIEAFYKSASRKGILTGSEKFPLTYYLTKFDSLFGLIVSNVSSIIIVLLGLSIAILILRKKNMSMMASILLIITLIFELFTFGNKFIISKGLSDIYPSSEIITFLKNDKEIFRILSLTNLLDRNIAGIYGISTIEGFDPYIIEGYRKFIRLIESNSEGIGINNVEVTNFNSPLLSLLNVKYLISQEYLENCNFKLLIDGKNKLYKNQNYFPRAFFSINIKVVPQKEKMSLLECQINRYFPNEVIIEGNAQEDGYLHLLDVYHPGWKAYVNGRQTKIYKSSNIFRAVKLAKGRYIVKFIFAPWSYKLGLIITIATLLFLSVSIIGQLNFSGKFYKNVSSKNYSNDQN